MPVNHFFLSVEVRVDVLSKEDFQLFVVHQVDSDGVFRENLHGFFAKLWLPTSDHARVGSSNLVDKQGFEHAFKIVFFVGEQ